MKKFELKQTEVSRYYRHYCDDDDCPCERTEKQHEELQPIPPDNDNSWELVASTVLNDIILYHWQRELPTLSGLNES